MSGRGKGQALGLTRVDGWIEMWLLVRIVTGLRRVVFRSMMVHSPAEVVAGLKILDGIDDGDSRSAMSMLADAVRLVAEYDSEAHAMMVKHFRAVCLTGSPVIGYQFATGACIVGRRIVQGRSRARLAAALVHEAMHGVLHQAGVPYRTETDRAAVERLCVEREAQFASFLPESEKPAQLAECIRAALDRPWWSQDLVERRTVELLMEKGAPRCFARLLVRLSRPE